MKIKYLAAACMAIGASSAFAVTPLACDATTALNMVNTCAPEAQLFVVGASAQGDALKYVLPADLFDTTTVPLIKVVDKASPSALANSKAVSAWYGMSKAAVTGGVSKRIFVVYNNQNGSSAGVSQLLAKLGTVPEGDVVTVGPTKNVANACTEDATSTVAVPVINCTSHAFTQADLAISDARAVESYRLYPSATKKVSTLVETPMALQGFGVAVSADMYAALQAQNIADGLMASSCVGVTNTLACQPSVRRADYSSLVSRAGSIKSAAALLPGVPSAATQVLTLARRDGLSGTQSSSNMFFANNACGIDKDAKGKLIKGHLGGALDIVSNGTDSATGPGSINDSVAGVLTVLGAATTSDVKAALNATGLAIGVVSLNTSPSGSDTWKFIKIDGASPNYNADGTVNAKARTFINGSYPFAMTSYGMVPVKAPKTGVQTTFPDVIPTVLAGMQDSTLHDLQGMGYLDGGSNPAKASQVHRTNGNNCSPLIK